MLGACGVTGDGSARTTTTTTSTASSSTTTTAAPDDDPASEVPAGTDLGSAGDPYFPQDGNRGYDVDRYELDLDYDPGTDELQGTATIRARATERLPTFHLDLQGMDVGSVTVDDAPADHERDGQELIVHPAAPPAEGAGFVVVVRYSGVPETIPQDFGVTGFVATDDGAYVIGEPDAAKTWYPVNDHPTDRAAYWFDVTVPAGLEVVANGRLSGQEDHGATTTWTWTAGPMASYLATVAIGEFELRRYKAGDVVYVDALDPNLEHTEAIDEKLAEQPEILAFLSEHFGRYPFASAGAIVDDADFDFALETQTRPIYSEGFFSDPDTTVVVHELAHQWFGDRNRLASWQHVWLNEGFASYAEWMWDAAHGGTSLDERFERAYEMNGPPSDPFWQLRIGDPGTGHLFDPPIYERGAMTLHALRLEVGEPAFARILRRWGTRDATRAASTEELIALAEDVSGRQLDEFFDAWLFTAGRPERP